MNLFKKKNGLDIIKEYFKNKDDGYYHLEDLDNTKSLYKLGISEKGPGKSFQVLLKILYKWKLSGYKKQGFIIRRDDVDIEPSKARLFFNNIVYNNLISILTDDEWDDVEFRADAYYLTKYDEENNKTIRQKTPFCYLCALSTSKHLNSVAFPNVTTIFFDEFIAHDDSYIYNEYITLMKLISTIKRERQDVEIYMMANTITMSSIYFEEFGLYNVRNLKQGEIQTYMIGQTEATISIEFPDTIKKRNEIKVDNYFAFDNPSLSIITGADGGWQFELFPHKPCNYDKNDIRYIFFIKWLREIFQCEIVYKEIDGIMQDFIYIHKKTTPLKNEDLDLIYSTEYNFKRNYNRSIFKPRNKTEQRILWYFNTDNVFYQDNTTGALINDCLKEMKRI